MEPRRLWRRYLIYNPYFVFRLFMQRLGFDRSDNRVPQNAKP
jgi:hypothetical protein